MNKYTKEELNKELTNSEIQDRFDLPDGFTDWNEINMDELADYLQNKYKYQSSGDAYAILRFVNYYREIESILGKI